MKVGTENQIRLTARGIRGIRTRTVRKRVLQIRRTDDLTKLDVIQLGRRRENKLRSVDNSVIQQGQTGRSPRHRRSDHKREENHFHKVYFRLACADRQNDRLLKPQFRTFFRLKKRALPSTFYCPLSQAFSRQYELRRAEPALGGFSFKSYLSLGKDVEVVIPVVHAIH